MKINSKSLMIGDWVYDKVLKSNARVEALQPLTIKCDIHTQKHICDEFEPVKLTPEILEKNGFERGNQYWYLPNNGSPVEFSIDDDWECGKHYFGVCCGKPFPLNCVHELQHALRLCGLDELADNFKI